MRSDLVANLGVVLIALGIGHDNALCGLAGVVTLGWAIVFGGATRR